jgi:predicted dehydrogenase
VLDSDSERTEQLASRWGARGYRDFDELLADPELDVVHICSPNATHAPYAIAAMRAGKHVVCEKPIATSVDDGAAMLQTAHETGVVATVPFVYRFHPIVREIRERRLRGDFGAWYTLHGHYLQDWMLPPAAGNWRVSAKSGGVSRAFGDIGSHWCDLVEFVSGERFHSLTAAMSIAIPMRPIASAESPTVAVADTAMAEVTTEDTAIVTFRTESGILGNVVVSQVAGGRRNRLWFEFDGANGSAVFNQEEPETAWLGNRDGATVIARGVGTAAADSTRLTYLPGGHAQGYQDCFNAFVTDTYAAIHGECPAGLPTFEDGLRAARVVQAVIESATTQQWVEPQRDI